MQFDRHIDSTAAEVPVKFQSDRTILNTNLAASRLYEILRKDVFSDIETGSWWFGATLRWPVNTPHKGSATRKMFPLTTSSWPIHIMRQRYFTHGNSRFLRVSKAGIYPMYINHDNPRPNRISSHVIVQVYAKQLKKLLVFTRRSTDSCYVGNEARHKHAHNEISLLQWRHNERDGVSNHRRHDCLLNRLFRRRSKETSKLRVTGLCEGNSPVTGEFPTQRASNAENASNWWRHHDLTYICLTVSCYRGASFH